ncbi:MAG: transcriptional repressor [Rhodospirillaceae bacterium]|jgi:Fur family zinc uptake transcriptional regulator|nr:transcriptional repressor [Rhodospirillaceae bacterium]MBT4219328.1 transcriptional repressor [Rhodospirillaceae bacterium]MBT7355999.1 transcriptional repressor [Rhodospirillaceae bacterium]
MGKTVSKAKIFKKPGHDHGRCIKSALDMAQSLCAARGARLTELRRRVLELVWASHRPIGAYDLLDKLKAERHNAAPPTVYRALEFLIELGLVHRIESLNAYMGCSGPDAGHSSQFLICRDCGSAAEINDARIDAAINNLSQDAGFSVHHHSIEVEGRCPDCRSTR